MHIYHGIGQLSRKYSNLVVVIGVFDGLHAGHQALIRDAIRKARAVRGALMVMTFSPHPVHVLHPKVPLLLLASLEHRLHLLEAMGVDACLVVRFTRRFSHQTPEQFIHRYIVRKLKARSVIVGGDFRFGQNREGTLDLFAREGKKYGFEVCGHRIEERDHKPISSTLIRSLISGGRFKDAQRLLGRPFGVLGKVVRGDGRGKLLGYPTANVRTDRQILPPLGVYAARVTVAGKVYGGMVNVGKRPSFSRSVRVRVEAHILGLHKDLYGRSVLIEFVKKVRNERSFPSGSALAQQIRKDEVRIRKILRMSPRA